MSIHVTMRKVAEQAGVTQATVSMCLANNPRIPVATRERIRAVAAKLGYQPNPYVSALMRVRRQGRPHHDKPVIALINGLETAAAWRDSTAGTVRQMREGAIARAAELGYRAELETRSARDPRVRYLPVVSRPEPADTWAEESPA